MLDDELIIAKLFAAFKKEGVMKQLFVYLTEVINTLANFILAHRVFCDSRMMKISAAMALFTAGKYAVQGAKP